MTGGIPGRRCRNGAAVRGDFGERDDMESRVDDAVAW
jgi:hypothetical protein